MLIERPKKNKHSILQQYNNSNNRTDIICILKMIDKYASLVTLSHVHLEKFHLERNLENPLPKGGLVMLIF